MTRSVRRELRLPLPLRPQRPRVGRRRAARRAATGTSRSRRSRSTRCTSRRASRRCGNATPGERGTGVLALEWGIAVRDAFPDHFLDWHIALFAARHDQGEKIATSDVLARGRDLGRSRRRRGRGRGRDRPAAQDARRRAHRGGQALTRCSASRRSSSATGPCSSGSWTATTPTTSTACSTSSSRPTSTSSSTRRIPLSVESAACGCRTPKRSCGRSRRTPRSAPTSATSRSSITRPTRSGCAHTLDRALAAIPRLRQRVVVAAAAHRPARVRRRPDPRPRLPRASHRGTRAGTTRARCSTCAAARREPARPVPPAVGVHAHRWALGGRRRHGGRAALLQKVHHTITDGVGGLKLSLALVDFEPDPIAPPEPDDAAAVTLDGSRGPLEVSRVRGHRRVGAQHRRAAQRRRRYRERAGASDAPCPAARSTPRASPARCSARASSPTAPTPTSSRAGRCAGTSRSCASRSPRSSASRTRSAAASTTRTSPASAPRSAATTRGSGSDGPGAAAGDAGQHARARRHRREPVRAGAGPRPDPARGRSRSPVRRGPRTARDHEAGTGAGRDREVRRARDAAADLVARGVHADPGAHDRLRRLEPARAARSRSTSPARASSRATRSARGPALRST